VSSGVGLGASVLELGARGGDGIGVAASGVVTAAARADFESVGEPVGMGAEGDGVAVDGHCGGNAVQPDKGAVSVGVAGEAAAGGDGSCRQVSRIERLEAAGGRVGEGALAEVGYPRSGASNSRYGKSVSTRNTSEGRPLAGAVFVKNKSPSIQIKSYAK